MEHKLESFYSHKELNVGAENVLAASRVKLVQIMLEIRTLKQKELKLLSLLSFQKDVIVRTGVQTFQLDSF